MSELQQEDIHLISRHSNLSETALKSLLKTHVHNSSAAWRSFLQIFFVASCMCFTVSGIIFFFAYNWAELHKFGKIGLVELLVTVLALTAVFLKNETIRNISITAAAVMTGLLFSVFGQVYQTGANAYDFFLGWTAFVSIWALAANFAPLWLIYVLLINTTLVLYSEQVPATWSSVFVCLVLFLLDTSFLLAFIIFARYTKTKLQIWFSNTLALAAVSFATTGICIGIFEKHGTYFYLLVLVTAVCYTTGILFGQRKRSGFYLSVIPFSILIMATAYLIELTDAENLLLPISVFVVICVTLIIRNLMRLQKKWSNE